jgi:release factor glutamine methyltransferase
MTDLPGRGSTIAEALRVAVTRLAGAGIDTPALDARVLLREAMGTDEAGLILATRERLPPEQAARFDAMLVRREGREPVALILGRREFWSHDFAVDRSTLIPRPDSETLVAAAIEALGDGLGPLLDLGTGSGCLLLSILAACRSATGVGVDRSEAAARMARANAAALGLSSRASFVVGDWAQPLSRRFAVIVTNPPYLATSEIAATTPEVRDFEPPMALDGGADGLSAYRALMGDARRSLATDGRIFLEVGAGQAQAVEALLDSHGLKPLGRRRDLAGVERCVEATLSREFAGKGN